MEKVFKELDILENGLGEEKEMSPILDHFTNIEKIKEKMAPVEYQAEIMKKSIQKVFEESSIEKIEKILKEQKEISSKIKMEAPVIEQNGWEQLKEDILVNNHEDLSNSLKNVENKIFLVEKILHVFFSHKNQISSFLKNVENIDKFFDVLSSDVRPSLVLFREQFDPLSQKFSLDNLQLKFFKIFTLLYDKIKSFEEFPQDIPKYR